MIVPGFNGNDRLRGAAVLSYRRWPNNTIPYDISPITSKIINVCLDPLSNVQFF